MKIHDFSKNHSPLQTQQDSKIAARVELRCIDSTLTRSPTINPGFHRKFEKKKYNAPNLRKLLSDKKTLKIFHFARFDLAAIKMYLEIQCTPVFCTRIASRLTRTYTDRHGLKDICSELIGVEISKQQQQSDWASSELTQNQREYAASDVLYLHQLKDVLEHRLKRENRIEIARGCFDFLKYQVDLDIQGWGEQNIFAHQ